MTVRCRRNTRTAFVCTHLSRRRRGRVRSAENDRENPIHIIGSSTDRLAVFTSIDVLLRSGSLGAEKTAVRSIRNCRVRTMSCTVPWIRYSERNRFPDVRRRRRIIPCDNHSRRSRRTRREIAFQLVRNVNSEITRSAGYGRSRRFALLEMGDVVHGADEKTLPDVRVMTCRCLQFVRVGTVFIILYRCRSEQFFYFFF